MKNNKLAILTKGIIKENPVLVLLLGTCPTLATTSSVFNGLGMGVSAMAVLICSNIVISLLRNIIPDKVRIPCYIVVIAGFVTVVQMLLQAFVPSLYASLGLFIPLIVVNCIILGRAEMFASKNNVIDSALDGIGMGLGFTLALGCMGAVREFFGAGSLLGFNILGGHIEQMGIFNLAPGGFFVFAILIAGVYMITKDKSKLVREFGCSGFRTTEADRRAAEKAKKAEAAKAAKAKAEADKTAVESPKMNEREAVPTGAAELKSKAREGSVAQGNDPSEIGGAEVKAKGNNVIEDMTEGDGGQKPDADVKSEVREG